MTSIARPGALVKANGTPKTPPCRRVIRAKHPGFRCQNYILEEEISAASSLAEKTQSLDVCRKKMEKLAVYSEARVECKDFIMTSI